jgi:hypothetical protein
MPFVLNEAQLRRIENVHSGFLYQHLYTVALMLSRPGLDWTEIAIERDEDIEVQLAGRRLYLQVKKRNGNLTFGDIADVLERFREIAHEHDQGHRPGTPIAWIISNAEPGPDLSRRIRTEWPANVFLRTPQTCTGDRNAVPVAGQSLEFMWEECVRLARRLPHSTLQPETLVWKLAAFVQYLAAGAMRADHTLGSNDFQPLLEQLVARLQSLPEPLEDYRPQEHEPPYQSEDRVRLITGFSGAGKTSWAGEFGTHTASPLLYFDVADMPSAGVPPALGREMAAFLLPEGSIERQQILLPGVSGLQSLRVINRFIAGHIPDMTIVLDNAHRVSDEVLSETVRAMPAAKWIVLAQDWPGRELFATATSGRTEVLTGWSRDTVARDAAVIGCFGGIENYQSLHDLTGGLPLFVRDAIRICKEGYRGDVAAYVADLAEHTSLQTTSQQVIVSQVLGRLSEDARAFASLLSIFTVPFSRDVVLQVIAPALRLTRTQAALQLRTLYSWGIIRSSAGRDVSLHDSFRLSAAERLADLSPVMVSDAREELYRFVWTTKEGGGPDKFRLLARLMFETHRIDTLIDLLTNTAEIVTEYGIEDEMATMLAHAAEDPSISSEDRFWAEDTLTFWALNRKDIENACTRFERVQAIVTQFTPSETIRVAVLVKELLIAGLQEDLVKLQRVYRTAIASTANAMARRIITYNYAHGLMSCGRSALAVEIATGLIDEYYYVLGITPNDVFLHRLDETMARIRDFENSQDEVKRLADSLDLQGSAARKIGLFQPFAKLHAHKFFILSNSFTSAVRVGLDFVDECIEGRGDADAARDFIENFLLQLVNEQKLIGALVPVSCQYAVVLAYCGASDLATQTLQEMEPYIVDGTDGAIEYEANVRLVERIRHGEVRLRERMPLVAETRPAREPYRAPAKIGRNAQCPCESGLKYKRCCGQ